MMEALGRSFAGVAASAALASGAILALLLKTGWAWRLAVDSPNARSLHTRPTPRVGGLALSPVALAGVAALGGPGLRVTALAAAGLAVVSFLDDRGGLPVGWRFGAQLLAAAAVVATGPLMACGWAWAAVAVLILVWMSNLYNFMDGSDGLAGGMAVAGFGALGLGAAAAGDAALGLASMAVAGAALGFLRYNVPPARVFMGDIGSVPLGFLAGSLSLQGSFQASRDWPPWFGALVFSPFIADASFTLLARLLRGERVWQAHREHVYQRLVAAGYGHRGTMLREYLLMAACAALALALRTAAPGLGWGVAVACALAYGLFFLFAVRRWPRP